MALAVTGGAFVCLGTLTSRSRWLAVAAMTLVAFGVLFACVVSSVLAGATTSLQVRDLRVASLELVTGGARAALVLPLADPLPDANQQRIDVTPPHGPDVRRLDDASHRWDRRLSAPDR